MKLDGLVIIGGDGSMQILKKLAKEGDMKIVAIPKTIDNDVGATESSIGFHTAVDVATQALDNLQSTAASHRRSMILEVMGRDAGHIALNAGIAGGADITSLIIDSTTGAFNCALIELGPLTLSMLPKLVPNGFPNLSICPINESKFV